MWNLGHISLITVTMSKVNISLKSSLNELYFGTKAFLLDHYVNKLLESFDYALHCFSTLLCQCHFRQNFGSSSSEESKLNLFHFIGMSSLINKSPKESFGGKVLITLSPPPPPI